MKHRIGLILGTIVALAMVTSGALGQIPYGAPATSSLLNSTFFAKSYPNTLSGANTFSGVNTFSGALNINSGLSLGSFGDGLLHVGSTTVTSSSVVNADVSSSAAIARSKLANGTANHVLINDGTGVMSSAAQLSVSLGGTGNSTGTATVNANLTGPITSVGNATSIASQTGTGSKFVVDTSPTLVTPVLGVATATSINSTSIPSSKTLVVTTDKVSALAATTSAELAGVISDETGTNKLVYSDSPTLVTPTLGAASATSVSTGSNTVTGSLYLTQATDSSTTGANAALSVTTPTTVLTNASLTSLGSIASPTTGQTITLLNRTGASITVVNEYASATAANRILTGSGSDLTLTNNASVIAQYSSQDSRWHVVGGSGSGGLNVKGQTDAGYSTASNVIAPHNQITTTASGTSLIETGNGNILPDPGFEALTSLWAFSGGATATTNSTAKGTGALGADWDSNAASQTLVSTSVTIPNGYQGKNGFFSCNIKTVSGTATHTITVNDGTNDIATAFTIPNSTTSFISTYNNGQGNFVYPASGTIRIKLTSVNANEPEIYVDDCKIGLADNVGSITPSMQLIGTVKVTGCAAEWQVTNTAYTAFGTQTGCTYAATGSLTAPATNIPGYQYPALGAGTYISEYEGAIQNENTNVNGSYQSFDGTNASLEESWTRSGAGTLKINGFKHTFTYTAPQPAGTMQIRGKSASGTMDIAGLTTTPGVFKLWYVPNSAQQAVSSAQADFGWTPYTLSIGGSTTAPTPGTNTQSAMFRRIGDSMEITYWFAQTAAGSGGSGTYLFPLPAGYTMDTSKITTSTANANASAATLVGLANFSNTNSAGTSSAMGGPVVAYNSTNLAIFGNNGTANNQTIIGQASFGIGATAVVNYSFRATVPIQGWSANQRAPTLIGSVTSNASGAERIERLYFTNSGTPTISSQSGSWVTSLTDGGVGRTTIVIPANTFSSAPTCTCNAIKTASMMSCTQGSASTTTAISIETINSANAYEDVPVYVTCMGPR